MENDNDFMDMETVTSRLFANGLCLQQLMVTSIKIVEHRKLFYRLSRLHFLLV